MKRFRRWLWNGLAALSLLLCLVTAVVWIRSYWFEDGLSWHDGNDLPVAYEDWRNILCSCGGIQIEHEHFEWHNGFFGYLITGHTFDRYDRQQHGYPYWIILFQWAPPTTDLRIKGFEFVYLHDEYNRIQSVTFPLAMIFLAAIVPPVIWMRREAKRRRQSNATFCASCGYDLRASPNRCPECGATPEKDRIIPRCPSKLPQLTSD
jgi:hypothetical protein